MTDYINDAKKRADDSGYFVTDYIKREDAARAMAKYMMDTALIDNPEASDSIEEWEGNIAKPVISTVPSADVVEVVRCKDCMKYNTDDCMMIHGKKMNRNIFANDYCSYGEREEHD